MELVQSKTPSPKQLCSTDSREPSVKGKIGLIEDMIKRLTEILDSDKKGIDELKTECNTLEKDSIHYLKTTETEYANTISRLRQSNHILVLGDESTSKSYREELRCLTSITNKLRVDINSYEEKATNIEESIGKLIE